jgi:hypothetical protein
MWENARSISSSLCTSRNHAYKRGSSKFPTCCCMMLTSAMCKNHVENANCQPLRLSNSSISLCKCLHMIRVLSTASKAMRPRMHLQMCREGVLEYSWSACVCVYVDVLERIRVFNLCFPVCVFEWLNQTTSLRNKYSRTKTKFT